MLKTCAHLAAGRRLCRATGMALRPLIPDSITSMTSAYNLYRTLCAENLPFPKTILDVGANNSQMARLLLGMAREAQVISFEPNPKLRPMGIVKQFALSDRDGSADFFLPQDNPLWGTLEARKDNISSATVRYPVRTRRMETLIESGEISWKELSRPILLKIDTEGSEQRVLAGFGEYLGQVTYLLVEVANAESREQPAGLTSLCLALSKHGFDHAKIVYACYDGPNAPVYSDIFFWKKKNSQQTNSA